MPAPFEAVAASGGGTSTFERLHRQSRPPSLSESPLAARLPAGCVAGATQAGSGPATSVALFLTYFHAALDGDADSAVLASCLAHPLCRGDIAAEHAESVSQSVSPPLAGENVDSALAAAAVTGHLGIVAVLLAS